MSGGHWATGVRAEADGGEQWPAAVPQGGDHPGGLLTDEETSNVLGIREAAVRAYATTGYLPAGSERHGRTWWPRRVAEARRGAGDQHHRTPGRKPGDPRNRAPRLRHAPRIEEIAELTTRAPLITADVVQCCGVGQRIAQRLLAAARTRAGS